MEDDTRASMRNLGPAKRTDYVGLRGITGGRVRQCDGTLNMTGVLEAGDRTRDYTERKTSHKLTAQLEWEVANQTLQNENERLTLLLRQQSVESDLEKGKLQQDVEGLEGALNEARAELSQLKAQTIPRLEREIKSSHEQVAQTNATAADAAKVWKRRFDSSEEVVEGLEAKIDTMTKSHAAELEALNTIIAELRRDADSVVKLDQNGLDQREEESFDWVASQSMARRQAVIDHRVLQDELELMRQAVIDQAELLDERQIDLRLEQEYSAELRDQVIILENQCEECLRELACQVDATRREREAQEESIAAYKSSLQISRSFERLARATLNVEREVAGTMSEVSRESHAVLCESAETGWTEYHTSHEAQYGHERVLLNLRMEHAESSSAAEAAQRRLEAAEESLKSHKERMTANLTEMAALRAKCNLLEPLANRSGQLAEENQKHIMEISRLKSLAQKLSDDFDERSLRHREASESALNEQRKIWAAQMKRTEEFFEGAMKRDHEAMVGMGHANAAQRIQHLDRIRTDLAETRQQLLDSIRDKEELQCRLESAEADLFALMPAKDRLVASKGMKPPLKSAPRQPLGARPNGF